MVEKRRIPDFVSGEKVSTFEAISIEKLIGNFHLLARVKTVCDTVFFSIVMSRYYALDVQGCAFVPFRMEISTSSALKCRDVPVTCPRQCLMLHFAGKDAACGVGCHSGTC